MDEVPRQALGAYRDAAGLALRLAATGTAGSTRPPDWSTTFAVAALERLGPLAWQRASAVIADAPPAVRDAWRREAGATRVRNLIHLEQMAAISARCRRLGVAPVWLKGLPLGAMLHGDPLVRPSADLDVFVAPADALAAQEVLREAGWTMLQPSSTGDSAWRLETGGHELWLETHVSLADWRLPHLRFDPPAARTVVLSGTPFDAFGGDQLAAYLAVNLAKHWHSPLLWWLEMERYWTSLAPEDRDRAAAAALRAGARRYLRWALRGVAAIARATAGNDAALAAVGVHRSGRRLVHPSVRHLRLADGWRDRWRALRPWLGAAREALDPSRARRRLGVLRRLIAGVAVRRRPPDAARERAT